MDYMSFEYQFTKLQVCRLYDVVGHRQNTCCLCQYCICKDCVCKNICMSIWNFECLLDFDVNLKVKVTVFLNKQVTETECDTAERGSQEKTILLTCFLIAILIDWK